MAAYASIVAVQIDAIVSTTSHMASTNKLKVLGVPAATGDHLTHGYAANARGRDGCPSTAPRFARSRWPSLRSGHCLVDDSIRPTPPCGSGCERTLCPLRAKRASITCVQRRSAHRIRGTTLVVGTGGAVRPLYPLLVRARLSVHRSDDRTSLRRSKVFPSLAGSRLSTAPCLGRHSLDPVTRGSTGVSVHRDFRSAPQSGSYGAP
jgi:hypothetical protein